MALRSGKKKKMQTNATSPAGGVIDRVTNKLDRKLVVEDKQSLMRSKKTLIIAAVTAVFVVGAAGFLILGNQEENRQVAPATEAENKKGIQEEEINAALDAVGEKPDAITKDESQITDKVMSPEDADKVYQEKLNKEAEASVQINRFEMPR